MLSAGQGDRAAVPSIDVAVVGAGPAGIGVAVALKDAGLEAVQVLERGVIGDSLRRWPRGMRCITPSFQASGFGYPDLNAIAPGTSPAHSLGCEHPTGAMWADYLKAVAAFFQLDVRQGESLERIDAVPERGGFRLETTRRILHARTLVWAAGELSAPRLDAFPGADLCRPVGTVRSWDEVTDREPVVIGGSESGIDAAVSMLRTRSRRRVTVVDSSAPWNARVADPSRGLSPYTRGRLATARASGRLDLRGDLSIVAAESARRGRVVLRCASGESLIARGTPLLATGYRPALGPAGRLFDCDQDGFPRLTEDDESTITPGLFLVGPGLRHEGVILCFAYKYRCRFPVVAEMVALSLGREPSLGLEAWRAAGMWVEDLSCCVEECAC